MTPSLSDLRRELRDTICRARAVERIVSSDEFEAAYSTALAGMVRCLDREGIERALKGLRERGLANMTLRELRELAQRLGIRSYNQLPKANLLAEIVHATQRVG